jgi:tellurite resistance protein
MINRDMGRQELLREALYLEQDAVNAETIKRVALAVARAILRIGK